jgi:hypothetical protein
MIVPLSRCLSSPPAGILCNRLEGLYSATIRFSTYGTLCKIHRRMAVPSALERVLPVFRWNERVDSLHCTSATPLATKCAPVQRIQKIGATAWAKTTNALHPPSLIRATNPLPCLQDTLPPRYSARKPLL